MAAYRWGVLLLAVAVWVRCFGDARLAEFGWQFRHLEVWALTASAASASAMVALSMGWSGGRHEAFVGSVAALNAVVVLAHLGPLGLAPSGEARTPWLAAYLYLVGPLLQIADATLILRVFDRLRGAAAGALGVALAYVAWVELAVRPLNASADGQGGLPYAALDAMGLQGRLGVYGGATALALLMLPALRAVQRAARRGAGGRMAAG